jgi:hypothetical protein
MSEFEKALQRPQDFFKLSGASQWQIDKSLGILDWDGGCDHDPKKLCKECKSRFNEHFGLKKKQAAPKLNPGSAGARKKGCVCPVMDNENGRGRMGQKGVFVVRGGCPLHGKAAREAAAKKEKKS